ncbi:MAG: CoB--CoM heterodisulfide reductase iron-sulfur subunit A family protein [Deltaproteobacteria bacterium]|nr:CoB--CoM heterodisulfide reductase iron-sulfur subunit A family protein [Deltaproteobacteria bacterium]
MQASSPQPVMVIGAGIAGITAALEAAESGAQVVLVEKDPSIGGRVLRSYHYFPKHCPPSCGMEINTRRLERNPRVRVLVNSQVTKATKTDQGWSVTISEAPLYVNDRCTACGECSKVCPAKVADDFNLGLCEVPAIRLRHPDAWPRRFVLNREACPSGCDACAKACKYGAINLSAKERSETLQVGSIVLATGWKPYPLEKLTELGGGKIPNVISNVHMERLASPTGPTAGKILRPSDSKPPKNVAFVQCAGSRDVKHLPYCSAVCCLASLKQAVYVKEQLPESEVTIYYIDRRTPGRNEDVLTKVAAMDGVKLVKGKVGKIESHDGAIVLRLEDVEAEKIVDATADLVVLATGMVSNLGDMASQIGIQVDADGFGLEDPQAALFVAGVARRPEDVAATTRDATGTAAKALVAAIRSA